MRGSENSSRLIGLFLGPIIFRPKNAGYSISARSQEEFKAFAGQLISILRLLPKHDLGSGMTKIHAKKSGVRIEGPF
ncbi:unnamed protein product [Gordionus sp. m RMFG-2023]